MPRPISRSAGSGRHEDDGLPVAVACETARAWLRQPYVSVLHPGDRHAEILFSLLESLGCFAGLPWSDPLG